MGSGSRLGNVPFRRPDWPHDLPSQWALSFEKTAVKLYIRDFSICYVKGNTRAREACVGIFLFTAEH
jgi:hypothetical protein